MLTITGLLDFVHRREFWILENTDDGQTPQTFQNLKGSGSLEFRAINKVQKTSDPECYTPPSDRTFQNLKGSGCLEFRAMNKVQKTSDPEC
jgi:hypothetical protein